MITIETLIQFSIFVVSLVGCIFAIYRVNFATTNNFCERDGG